ncbi:MAG: hypothetical protein R3C97_16445 [Geminicoccaceae bacterium]
MERVRRALVRVAMVPLARVMIANEHAALPEAVDCLKEASADAVAIFPARWKAADGQPDQHSDGSSPARCRSPAAGSGSRREDWSGSLDDRTGPCAPLGSGRFSDGEGRARVLARHAAPGVVSETLCGEVSRDVHPRTPKLDEMLASGLRRWTM